MRNLFFGLLFVTNALAVNISNGISQVWAAQTPPDLNGTYNARVMSSKGSCKVYSEYQITQTSSYIFLKHSSENTLLAEAASYEITGESIDGGWNARSLPLPIVQRLKRDEDYETDPHTKKFLNYPEVIFSLKGRWETDSTGNIISAVSGSYTKQKSFGKYGDKKIKEKFKELNIERFEQTRELVYTSINWWNPSPLVPVEEGCNVEILLTRLRP